MTAYVEPLASDHHPWAYALAFDYSPDMVTYMKAAIPSRARKWVPEDKVWLFRREALDTVLELADNYCGGWRMVRSEPAPMPTQPLDAYAALHLLPSAPPDLVQAAYRVIAKQAHPDRGGSTEAMQRVNAAYELIANGGR